MKKPSGEVRILLGGRAYRYKLDSTHMAKKNIEYTAKVLFLHGYTQLALAFYAKTLALRKKLAQYKLKAVYLNAPIQLSPAELPTTDLLSKFGAVGGDDDALKYRAWWVKNPDNTYEIDSAIDTVKRYIKDGEVLNEEGVYEKEEDNLPLNGIIGFSQGACFAGALVHKFHELFGIDLEFAVLYSGFKIDVSLMPDFKKYYTNDDGALTKPRLLHVVGELDTVVGEDRAYTFYETSTKNLDLLKHPGGHFVPNSKLLVDQVVNWIQGAEKEEAKKEEKKDDVDDILAMMDKVGV